MQRMKGALMNFGDLKGKVTDAVKDVISDEAKSDSVLDKVEDAAKKVTGGKFDEQIDAARDAVDGKIGE